MKQITILCFLVLLCFLTTNLRAQKTDSLEASPTLKKGIYLSLQEFVNNRPSMTDTFNIEKKLRTNKGWEGTYSHIPRSVGTGRRIVEIYGFSDGEKQYIFHRYDFFEINKIGNEYRFWGFGKLTEKERATMGVMFGVVGVGIQALAEANLPHRQQFILDAQTGDISVVEKSSFNLIVYRRAKKENEDTLSITINDSLQFDYIPNSYHSMSFPLSDEQVKVCINEQESCLFMERDSVMTKYLKVSALKADDDIKLEEVDTEQGEFESVIPMKRQKSRGY